MTRRLAIVTLSVAATISTAAPPPPLPITDDQPGDYIACYTAWLDDLDPEDRAYPEYEILREKITGNLHNEAWYARPGDPGWDRLALLVTEHRDIIKTIRSAASRPVLGAPFLVEDNENDLIPAVDDDDVPYMMQIVVPYLGTHRNAARLLNVNARIHALGGETDLAIDSLVLALGISRHTAETPFMICELVRVSIVGLTIKEIGALLQQPNVVWTDAQLAKLQHALQEFNPDLRPALHFQRCAIIDMLRWMFRVSGDGTFTPDVACQLLPAVRALGEVNNEATDRPKPYDRASTYAIMGGDSVRPLTEQIEMADALFDSAAPAFETPWYDLDQFEFDQRFDENKGNVLGDFPYSPVVVTFPEIRRCLMSANQMEVIRRATLLALAIHRHHMRHDAWPPTLDDLDSDLSPIDIIDLHSGEPLRYKLTDAGPLIYSTGPDRDDDNARPLLNPDGSLDSNPPWLTRAEFRSRLESDPTSIDGDWILYPPQP